MHHSHSPTTTPTTTAISTPTRRLCSAMAAQHGVATTATARSAGLGRRAENRLVRDGVLHRPVSGVLVSTSAPPTWEQRAAVAVLAPGCAVLSHGAAARLHHLSGFEHHDRVEVICRKGWWPDPPPGTITHFTRGLAPGDVTVVAGIRTLTVATTLTLLAPVVGIAATRRALDGALRLGHDPDELRSVATRWRSRGRPGPAALHALLDERR